jgi:hypothetical protein
MERSEVSDDLARLMCELEPWQLELLIGEHVPIRRVFFTLPRQWGVAEAYEWTVWNDEQHGFD